MTDQPITAQPDNPGQQENWEARYKGASALINKLQSQIDELKAQLSSHASEKEQLKTNLSLREVEKDTAIGGYKKQLEDVLTEKQTVQAELNALRAMKAKLDTAKKLGDSRLYGVLDAIPYVENPEAQEEIMKTFMTWGEGLVKEREKQLLAGVVPTAPAAPVQKTMPSTSKDWSAYVNNLPLGSPEREQAYNEWMKWGMSQGR